MLSGYVSCSGSLRGADDAVFFWLRLPFGNVAALRIEGETFEGGLSSYVDR